MIVTKANRKEILDFLIRRWSTVTVFAALEKVHYAKCEFAKANNIPIPNMPTFVIAQSLPCRQIEIIKLHIMAIIPEAHFINYDYEAQIPLDPNDFMEVYVDDHKQCIEKVREVMNKLRII